jgi:uncharacterized RDD family membrane protein YckC
MEMLNKKISHPSDKLVPLEDGPPPMPIFHDYREDFTVYPTAGFVLRWYALTLDIAFSTPLSILFKLPFNRYLERLSAYGHQQQFITLTLFLAAIPFALYFLAPVSFWGVTLGKKIVGLRVVSNRGHFNLSFSQVIRREVVGKLLSVASFGLGFFMVAINTKRLALHDQLSQTRVITYREEA